MTNVFNEIMVQVLPQLLFMIITTLLTFITLIAKKWWIANQSLIEAQRQHVIQKIGIDKYNQDVEMAKTIIKSIEEQARSIDWTSEIKHAKATEIISGITSLSSDQIFNIIKATVDELNASKPKTVATNTDNTTIINNTTTPSISPQV